MNAIVNISSRRKSIAEYDAILNKLKEQQVQEASIEEEQRNRTNNEMESESQRKINVLCNAIQRSYMMMVKEGQKLEHSQVELEKELPQKMKEAELFYATVDEIYPYKKLDESLLRKMRLRRIAYYLLPVLDCFFAYLALFPIVTSKIANLSPMLSGTAEIIGVFFSIAVGLGVSLISRFGVSSLEDNDNWNIMKWIKIVAIIGAVFALPSMYIISEVTFNGGEQWTYSGCFAFISLIIQLLIVSGYKRQIEALMYFQEKVQNESVKHIKEADEDALSQEIKSIQDSTENIISSFNKEYVNFTENFIQLAEASDEHIQRFGKAAKYYLNHMIIYFGDLVCFNHDVIPLLYHNKGTESIIPFADFPRVYCDQAYLALNDYKNLDYIMQRAHMGVSLSETIREIESHHSKVNTYSTKDIETFGSLTQDSKMDVENNGANIVSTTDYDEPIFCDDDNDCCAEDNTQNEIEDVPSSHSRLKSIIEFAKSMFEEEDDDD